MSKEKATTKEATATTAEAKKDFNLEAAVAHYREHSTIQQNGIRRVDKDTIVGRLETAHGVDMAMVHKFHEAMMDERSALTELTAADLEANVRDSRKANASDETIAALSNSTTFWRPDGEETTTVLAQDTSGDTTIDEGGNVVPVTKHGRIRTSINGRDGIRQKTVDDVAARIAGLFA